MTPGLDTTYTGLDAHAQELYRALGVHPSHRFIPAAAEAMLAADTATADQAVTALHATGLIQPDGTGYVIPPLVQDHASSVAQQTGGPAPVIRMRVIHQTYLPLAADADYRINPHPHRYNADHYAELVSGRRVSRFPDNTSAMTWFAAEIGTLAALQRTAQGDGDHGAVWRLAEASWGYLLKARNNELLPTMHLLGSDSARRSGSPAASVLLSRLSWAHRNQGHFREAIEAAATAYRLAAHAGDEQAQSIALSAQGRALCAAGEVIEALTFLRESLRICEGLGDSVSVALRLRHIAECYIALACPDEAARHLRAAAARMRLAGNREGLGRCLIMLSQILATSNPEHALHEAHAAAEAMQSSGSDCYLADALACAGEAAAALGDSAAACRYYQRSQDLYAVARDTAGVARMALALRTAPPSPHY